MRSIQQEQLDMKRKSFNEEQIIGALEAHKSGQKVADICRQLGIAEQTFYRWRAKYGGMSVAEAKRLRQLEAENSKLKRLIAEKTIDCEVLREIISKRRL